MVPTSFEDMTQATRGQQKRLSQNYLKRNGGNIILYVSFVSYQRCFLFSQPTFFSAFVRWAFHYFTLYSADFNCNGNEYNGCLFIKLLFCYLRSERLPALWIICLFDCLAYIWAFVCFELVCLNISVPFIQPFSCIVWRGHQSLI